MRTITVNQLNTLVDQAFERLERYTTHPETCPWFSANSVELAETKLDEIRHAALDNMARYEEHPFRPYYSLSNVLACWVWWFVVRRNNGGCPAEDVDGMFLAALGAEVKRLGFQLAR